MEEMNINIFPNINVLVSDMDGIRTACADGAELIAAQARSIAPVESGNYVAGISVDRTKGGARVYAGDQKSHWIEFGNSHQPAQFILRRAAEMVGFTFSKKKKRR